MSRGMITEEKQVERLDKMLKEFVEDMKPYVLNLKTKDEKQTVSAWIKKLCHPSITTVVERKNRNLYAQILLHMLLKDEIREPFLTKPNHGKLPTIPAYMSNYLDSTSVSKQQKSFTGPDWLQGEEFDDSILSQTMSHQSYNKYKDVLSPKKREKFMLSPPTLGSTTEAKFKNEKHSMDYLELSDLNELEKYLQENKENFSSTKRLKSNDDVGKIDQEKSPKQLDDRLRRPNITKNQSNREKELELKLRLTEGKIQEETLKIQQQHDQMIKKILDRKNHEITDVKSYYQKKITELEISLQQHGKTEKQLNDDMMIIKEKHALEVDELKDAIRRSAANTATEYEKLMYDKLSDFEKEIFNLQKVHRQNINELVAEADEKMKIMTDGFSIERKEMEANYKNLVEQHDITKKSQEVLCMEKDALLKEKEKMKEKMTKMNSTVEETNMKVQALESENKRLMDEYETVVRDLRKKSDEAFSEMKKERTNSAAKTAANITELESKLNQYRQTIQDMELTRKRELKEQEVVHQQAKVQLEMEEEKKMSAVRKEFEKKESEYEKKIREYELLLKEKEAETRKLEYRLTEHAKETETVIEKFKKEADINSNRAYQDLNAQLQQLQQSLSSAKEKIEQQKVEFARQLEEQKNKYEDQLEHYKGVSEREKMELIEKHTQEKDILHQSYKNAKDDYLKKEKVKKSESDEKYRQKIAQHMKQISELEAKVRDLREEVIQANALRKDQLQEVSSLRNEEKQAAKKSEESLKSKYKSQLEQERLQLQKEHSTQVEAFTEKMDGKLKDIAAEYSKKEKNDKLMINSLQLQLATVNADMLKKTNSFETNMNEVKKKNEVEKKATEENLNKIRKDLNNELETQKIKYKQLERKYRNMEVQYKEKISGCMLECEEKINGMLPASVKKELEDTIESMRQQIFILQSRAAVLQEELEECTKISKQKDFSRS